jgi:F0F1-type ATP synthase assembly protein I
MVPEQKRPDEKNDEKNEGSFIVQMARYSELAFLLPAATFVGWIIGVLLDRWLHTSKLYLVGLLLGIVAGFVQLIRTVTREEKED